MELIADTSSCYYSHFFEVHLGFLYCPTHFRTFPFFHFLAPRHMYWTDWDPARPRIERASLADGSGRIVVAGSGLIQPNGLTIDYIDNRIFWADAVTDKIESANLDGTDRQLVYYTGAFHPFGLVSKYFPVRLFLPLAKLLSLDVICMCACACVRVCVCVCVCVCFWADNASLNSFLLPCHADTFRRPGLLHRLAVW